MENKKKASEEALNVYKSNLNLETKLSFKNYASFITLTSAIILVKDKRCDCDSICIIV